MIPTLRSPLSDRLSIDSAGKDRLATGAFWLLMLAAFVYLSLKARGNTFYYDDWAWVAQRRTGLHAILHAYNGHLLIAPIALYQLLFATVGLDHYWVFRLFGVLAHIALCGALFLLVRRRTGPIIAALMLAPVLVLGSGWEYVLEPINTGFVASLALGVASLLLLERDDRRGDLWACCALVLAMVCSEFALAFVAGFAVGRTYADRGPHRAWIWGIPLLLYAGWWLGFHDPSSVSSNLTLAPGFGLDASAAAAGGIFGQSIDWGRPLIVIGLLGLGRVISRPAAPSPRLLTVLIAGITWWLLLGLGRGQGGDPTAARYVYTGVVFLMLIAGECLADRPIRRQLLRVGAPLALFAVLANVHALTDGERQLLTVSAQMKAELGGLALDPAVVPATFLVDQGLSPGLTAAAYFAATRSTNSSVADDPIQISAAPEVARTGADAILMRLGSVSISSGARTMPPGAAIPQAVASAGGSVQVSGRCDKLTPIAAGAAFDVVVPSSGLELRAISGSPVPVRARRFASLFDGSPVAMLAPGTPLQARVRPDRIAALDWHIGYSGAGPVLACSLR